MNLSRCPDLDRLNRELIEAYRRIEDRDIFCLDPGNDQSSEVAAIHRLMADHCKTCPLCRQHATYLVAAERSRQT